MLARLWTTKCRQDRVAEYELFARETSTPMFQSQPGFLGLSMFRNGEDCFVLTFWRDQASVDGLAQSASYLQTVQKIIDRGFLFGEQTVKTGSVHEMTFGVRESL